MEWHKVPPLHWTYGALIAGMVTVALLVGWGSGRLAPEESPSPSPAATEEA